MQVTIEQWYYQNVLYVMVKKKRFIKNPEAKGLLSNLGIRTPLTKYQYWVIFCFECILK